MIVIVLCDSLCAFMYLTFRAMPELSLRFQKRALTFIVLAGLFVVAAQLRYALEAVVAWREGEAEMLTVVGSILVEAPAILC
ncbi:MAG: hypothetical protein ACRDSJ_14120, partial [Rubrobacteraceae bacterium]